MESVSNEHPNNFEISEIINWVTQGRSRVVIYLMMTSVQFLWKIIFHNVENSDIAHPNITE